MDTKLITFKSRWLKLSLFFTCILILTSCFHNRKYLEKERFVDEFRYISFLECVKEGHNNSSEIIEILDEETYIGDFPLGIKNYKLIDSLSLVQKNKIVIDSIDFYNRWIERSPDYKIDGLSGKRVFLHCLDYYASIELDSIAKAVFKSDK